jgi:hypothetical protein
MDKITPKDAFQANRDRAAPLLAKLKAEGIGHIIDGKMVPSVSGATFETKSPVDNAVLAAELRKRPPSADALWRHEIIRDRPQRRRLFIRLLHGNQARLAGQGDAQDSEAGGLTKIVIPGRDKVASPESITTIVSMDSGPAPRGASRNDELN